MSLYTKAYICVTVLIIGTRQEDIYLDIERVHHVTAENFIGVTIDSGILRRHWENFNPQSQKIQTLAKALSPCYLRVGGNDADFLIFDKDHDDTNILPELKYVQHETTLLDRIHSFESTQKKFKLKRQEASVEMKILEKAYFPAKNKDQPTNFTMSAKTYDQLHAFVRAVGWLLIFDLNVVLRNGRNWEPANALQLMKYTVDQGYTMAGWELGNEPDNFKILIGNFTLAPEQLSVDYKHFTQILQQFSQYRSGLILGPSVAQLSVDWRIDYYKRFLNSGGGDLVTTATFHQYYIDGATATLSQFTDPDVLNVLIKEVELGVNISRTSGSRARVWLGETSSAWGQGAKGLTDSYVAAFMWLDKLGIAAAGGLDVVIRQSFYGYNYSLIDNFNYDPHPDYWLTLMYKLLVGRRVLRVTSPDNRGHLRAYVHCTATDRSGYLQGSIVMYVMNLQKYDQNLTFPQLVDSQTLHVYSMEPLDGNLTTKTVLLNGMPLKMVDDSTMPNLIQPQKTTAPVTIKAHTYMFIVFPDIYTEACASG